jgi:hypothetical protein
MANIDRIYSAWGNAEEMASDLGEKGVTVRQWRNRGNIPPEHWARIIEKAAARGTDLTVEDFGPNPEVLAIAKAVEAEKRAAA